MRLSLYETALAALVRMTTARARVLLTEVAAAGDSLDEGLREKVDGAAREAVRRQGNPMTRPSTTAKQPPATLRTPRRSPPRS